MRSPGGCEGGRGDGYACGAGNGVRQVADNGENAISAMGVRRVRRVRRDAVLKCNLNFESSQRGANKPFLPIMAAELCVVTINLLHFEINA